MADIMLYDPIALRPAAPVPFSKTNQLTNQLLKVLYGGLALKIKQIYVFVLSLSHLALCLFWKRSSSGLYSIPLSSIPLQSQ